MKKAVIILASMIILAVVINSSNILNKPKIQESITITADSSQKLGSVWYVNDLILDPSFRRGFSNPKVGDSVDISVDDNGIVVDWKVDN